MPDAIPPQAVQAAAQAITNLSCEHEGFCFECEARAALQAAAPFMACQHLGPDAPARASTPPYAEEKAVPRLVGLTDDPTSLETPTALRERYAGALRTRINQSVIVVMGDSTLGALHGQPLPTTEYDLADAVLAVRDDELAALRAELHRMTLAYNGANAMMRVHKLSADRRRVELEHAKGALAGDSEAVRLFMEDSSRRVERLREQRDMWQQEAEQAEAAADRILALAKQARPAAIAACACWDCEDEEKPNCGRGRVIAWDLDPTAVLAALDVPADGEQTETPEEGPR